MHHSTAKRTNYDALYFIIYFLFIFMFARMFNCFFLFYFYYLTLIELIKKNKHYILKEKKIF